VVFVALLVLVVGLLVYGNLVAYRAVRAPVVVAVNLVLGGALVAAARALGLSWHALGLGPSELGSGVAWGLGTAVAAALGGAVIAATPLRRLFADLRAVDMAPRTLRFHYLVRIPFGTALFEEVVFRGILVALLAGGGPELPAILASSAAFGLWHIGASLDLLRANRPDAGAGAGAKALAVATGVALTFLGGIGFAVLRLASESLAGPVLAHAAINVVGFTLARPEPAVP
jgi:membrane protease YdiL (CAAX protease family)